MSPSSRGLGRGPFKARHAFQRTAANGFISSRLRRLRAERVSLILTQDHRLSAGSGHKNGHSGTRYPFRVAGRVAGAFAWQTAWQLWFHRRCSAARYSETRLPVLGLRRRRNSRATAGKLQRSYSGRVVARKGTSPLPPGGASHAVGSGTAAVDRRNSGDPPVGRWSHGRDRPPYRYS